MKKYALYAPDQDSPQIIEGKSVEIQAKKIVIILADGKKKSIPRRETMIFTEVPPKIGESSK